MAAIVRTPVLQVYDVTSATWISDTSGVNTTPTAFSASTTHGFDMHVATAEVHLPPTALSGLNYWDDLRITMGTSRASSQRFQGFITGFDWTLYPAEVIVRCSGHLILADRFENEQAPVGSATYGGTQVAGTGAATGSFGGDIPFTPGLTDAPTTATTNPATLDGIIKWVLNICGITTAMVTDLSTGHSTILGTGQVLGTVAIQDYLWSQGESGLSYINRIDEIALGYRTFDAPDGTVRRALVSTVIPGSPTITATFTEGVDIFSGKSPRSVLPLRNGILAQGYSQPSGLTVSSKRSATSSYVPTPPGTIWQDLTSRLMECSNPTDLSMGGTVGISCYAAAGWLLNELNQLQVKLDMDTFREDLIVPGDIIAVNAPTRLDLMSTPMWVQSVTNSINEQGAYTQKLTCIRGAP